MSSKSDSLICFGGVSLEIGVRGLLAPHLGNPTASKPAVLPGWLSETFTFLLLLFTEEIFVSSFFGGEFLFGAIFPPPQSELNAVNADRGLSIKWTATTIRQIQLQESSNSLRCKPFKSPLFSLYSLLQISQNQKFTYTFFFFFVKSVAEDTSDQTSLILGQLELPKIISIFWKPKWQKEYVRDLFIDIFNIRRFHNPILQQTAQRFAPWSPGTNVCLIINKTLKSPQNIWINIGIKLNTGGNLLHKILYEVLE